MIDPPACSVEGGILQIFVFKQPLDNAMTESWEK